jgi:WD40 repeat protein
MGVAFSPDGRTFVLATAGERSGGGVEIYKKDEEGSFVRSVEFPTDRGANVVAFSRNGKLLAASQPNGQVMLIDAEAQVPRLIAILTSTGGGQAGRLAFNSDASLLAVIGSESSAILWDVATRTQFGRPIKLGYYDGPTGVAFSRENQLLAADANLDSMVSFDLSVDSWIAEACKVARRELTDAERTFYKLPADAPKTCASRPAAASAR